MLSVFTVLICRVKFETLSVDSDNQSFFSSYHWSIYTPDRLICALPYLPKTLRQTGLSTYCSPRSGAEKIESEIFHTRNGFRNCQFVSLSHSEEFLYVRENDK